MDHQAIVDVVLKGTIESLPGEVGSLLGQEISCSDLAMRLASKESILSETERGKSTLSHMTVSGDLDGSSYILTPTSAAIILGGTLIMLPEDSIAEQASAEKLEGEVDDAFGEVANILAGILTQVFLDKYPQNLRFVKTTLEAVEPSALDPAEATPFPPGTYYIASCNLTMGDQNLGLMEFIFPAAILGLEPEEAGAEAGDTPEAETGVSTESPADETAPPAQESAATADEMQAEEPPAEAPAKVERPPFNDAKSLIDVVIKAFIGQMGEEVGALIGTALTCDDLQLEMISKSDYFSTRFENKSVLTRFDASGDKSGTGYLINNLADAVILGGTLIMLPEDQIAEQIKAGEFDPEVADSFGEVANIIAGGLTQAFLDRYSKQLRFVKKDTEVAIPAQLKPEDDTPFPGGDYYLASCSIGLEGHELHRLDLLLPAELLELDGYAAGEPAQKEAGDAVAETAQAQAAAKPSGESPPPQAPAAPEPTGPPIILIVSEKPEDAEPIATWLKDKEYNCEVLNFQDNIKDAISNHKVLCIFLLMAEVGEKGFAAAIKIQSARQPQPPMIAGGPEWTRSTVLQAVKYGARDILILPASDDDIEKLATQHLSAS